MLCELLPVSEDYMRVHDRSWFVVGIMNTLKECGKVLEKKVATLLYHYVAGDDQSHQLYQQVIISLMTNLGRVTP